MKRFKIKLTTNIVPKNRKMYIKIDLKEAALRIYADLYPLHPQSLHRYVLIGVTSLITFSTIFLDRDFFNPPCFLHSGQK